jgi:hypothetical protein
MAGTISPIYDAEAEALKRQMSFANALRDKGMSNDIGQGYRGGRVFIVGNPLSNILSSIGGAVLSNRAEEGQRNLEQRMGQERQNWLNSMPQASTEKTVELEGPTETGDPLTGTTSVLKSAKQRAMENQAWAMQAPRGMEGVQQFALQQALTAPQREEEARQKAEDRKAELDARLAQASQLAQDRNAIQQGQNEATMAFKNAALGIQQQNADTARMKAEQPTPAQLKAEKAAEDKKESQTRANSLLDEMNTNIDILDKNKGITNPDRNVLSNTLSWAQNTGPGQLLGKMGGTTNQKARNNIESLATNLVLELKNVKGLGASQMNSNMELQRYLTAVAGGQNYDAQSLRDVVRRARDMLGTQQSGSGDGGKTVKRRVTLKDGRIGIEWSDGSRTIE